MAELQIVDIYYPDREQILHAVDILKNGGVIVYPTDTIYGLAADILNKEAVLKIFKIKKVSKQKLLSLIFSDLKGIADWAHIPNGAFRLMRRVLPGQYTFILPASKELPKSIVQKRTTMGVRVPDSEVVRRLIDELGRPLLSSSVPKGADDYFTDPGEIAERYNHEIDLILDGGIMPTLPSTVVDFTVDPPEILREGAGDVNALF
ncbi:MAG: threonylcarbamoyl-AMP synthase [Candidatus Aminicenantes bacterium]|nr:threonylcarbamoyl-AMP synthase [Candidatus Aminicenantes bacterium]